MPDSPASLQHLVVKAHSHTGVGQASRDDQALEQVVPPITARLAERNLGTSHSNGLARIDEEEGEDTGRVSKRVGTAEDDKALVGIPVLVQELGDDVPV